MFRNYLKIAFKVMMRNKLFTFISLFGISFTLLIIILFTSALDHTFGPHYPELKLDRTLSVTMGILRSKSGGTTSGPLFSPYFLNKYVKSLKTPEKISLASFYNPIVVYRDNKKLKLGIKYTDSEFWDILDFNFSEGKSFNREDVDNIANVAVINEKVKDQYFDGEPAVGKYIEADGKAYRVIGVVENVSILRIMPYSDIWVPLGHTSVNLDKITVTANFPGWFSMILAGSKKDFPKIEAEFQKHMENVEFPEGRFNSILTNTSSYGEAFARQVFQREEGNLAPFMTVLFLLMTLFMLLPTVNLVNINISRIIERSSEIGIRKSFGASSLTLVGQFITENIIITVIGGFISLVMVAIILSLINQSGIIPNTHLSLNLRIFFYSMIIAVFFGFLSGVYPALKMSKLQPAEAISGGKK